MSKNKFNVVNKSIPKVDGLSLVTGQPLFTDDIDIDGLLYAKILWSPYPHAIIKNIDTSKAEKVPGVKAILTYKDVPRIAFTTAGQGYPEPSPYDTFVLDKKVRFVGDRVAAVAATSLEVAEEALELIKVEYEQLEPVLDMMTAQEKGKPIIHDEKEARMILPLHYDKKKNLAAHAEMSDGDVEEALKNSEFIFDNEYEAHYAQHCPMEPHICITYFDAYNRLIIRSSTQVPFHVRRIVGMALNIPVKKIRVIKPRIGGGFGCKQEVLIEDICSALTLKTGKPVKLEYMRKEEFISSRTRHPQHIRLRTGINKDGQLTAIDMNIVMNNGAYGAHALTVICNSASKVLPLFNKVKNIKFYGDTVYTNLPVGGAYRGYGATQAYNAMGQQIDIMCRTIGMDIIKFYKMQHIKEGEGSPVFQKMGEGKEGVEMKIGACGLSKCIDIGVKEFRWYEKVNKKRKEGNWHYGVGMVCLMQGSSIPEIDMGAAFIKMNDDGSFNLLLGATDIGTGSDTIFAQMAAEVLTVKPQDIIVYSSDTDMTPFDVGAYASSTTYLSGGAVIKAAEKVKEQILEVAAQMLKTEIGDLELKNASVFSKSKKKKVTLKDVAYYSLYEKNQHQIAAVASHITHKSPPPFSAHFVEVAVDIETGLVKVVEYLNVTDCGTAINPKLAEGQCEGAVLNGISYALTEEYIFDSQGRMLNPSFNNYKIFSPADAPKIKTILVPTYEDTGPFGAKSISEIGINGPLPAIANAIYDAMGVRLKKGPYSPEKVYMALNNKK
ncbi:MAG TPA: molybdopterin-dependent oxidoreductase [bacterium]|nr:molybdopterin-dependent oxidoreductase [bacterium]HPQ17664.1 molybdopterin-dependent oxidoreductase [bacterium]